MKSIEILPVGASITIISRGIDYNMVAFTGLLAIIIGLFLAVKGIKYRKFNFWWMGIYQTIGGLLTDTLVICLSPDRNIMALTGLILCLAGIFFWVIVPLIFK